MILPKVVFRAVVSTIPVARANKYNMGVPFIASFPKCNIINSCVETDERYARISRYPAVLIIYNAARVWFNSHVLRLHELILLIRFSRIGAVTKIKPTRVVILCVRYKLIRARQMKRFVIITVRYCSISVYSTF